MKFQLNYFSGFSSPLVRWEATIFVGRRGSVTFHWFHASEGHDKSLRRYEFGLDAESFERLARGLVVLPEELVKGAMEGGTARHIRIVWEELDLERYHSPAPFDGPGPAEQEFERIWFELCAIVQPALLKLEIDPELLSVFR